MDGPQPDSSVGVVLIAEDPIVRAVLAETLRGAGAEVLLTLGTAADLAGVLVPQQAQAIVWDLGLRPDDALEPDAELWRRPEPVLAIVPDPASATEALALGAHGVVSREATGAEIVAAVRAIAAGLIVLSPALRNESSPTARHASSGGEELTPRETEVVALLAEGLSNKAIAARLGISEHTAKFHVNAVLQKLGAQTRTEAVVRAARLGLVTI